MNRSSNTSNSDDASLFKWLIAHLQPLNGVIDPPIGLLSGTHSVPVLEFLLKRVTVMLRWIPAQTTRGIKK